EAMSCAMPCVGTDVGGTSEIIRNEYNGYLLPGNVTAKQIADCFLSYYYLTPQEKQVLRSNALQTWVRDYNAETNYSNFAKAIKTMAQSKSRASKVV
ncbi:MAG: glycosyltransferase, partial [Bacteroidota bacterium]